MERWLVIELGAVLGGTAFLACLGWLMQRRKTSGAVLVGLTALAGGTLCILTTVVGYGLADSTGGWIGLFAGMGLAAVLFPPRLAAFIKAKDAKPFVFIWLGVCTLCLIGYLLGDWPGVVVVPVTTIVILLWLLYRFSKYVLPLRDPKTQQTDAFRCLLTVLLGTNWPFFFVKDGKAKKRIDGNPFRQFFAGPGLVYAEPDQAAYVTDAVRLTRICGPGLNFTGLREQEVIALDLRPQVRSFAVEALTKDGIRVRVMAFTAFRLSSGKREVQQGGAFPYSHRTVQRIARHELTTRRREKTEDVDKHTWNGSLVPLLTKPIVQSIVSRYSVDELCSPLDPDGDPRHEIAQALRGRLRRILADYGLELIGASIGNLVPLDETVVQRRLDNWKTEWEHQILLSMSQGRSDRARHIETARAQAELQILHRLGQAAREGAWGDEASQIALSLRFIDCLREVVSEADPQYPLPESCRETLVKLRGEIEEGQR